MRLKEATNQFPTCRSLSKIGRSEDRKIEQVHGADAENALDAVKDTLVSMPPQFGLSRSEKMNLRASRVSLSFASHMREADISQDNSNAYKGAGIVPCCFLKELRSVGDSASGLPYYYDCPDHGTVTANQVVIFQSDGGQPFEVMQLRATTEDEIMHETLHKFQVSEYQKFATGSVKMHITTTPSKDVHDLLSTPRQAKRLKIQHTADIADPT